MKLYRVQASLHVTVDVGVRVPDAWTVKDVRRFLRQEHPIVLHALLDEAVTMLEDEVHYGPPQAATHEDGMEEVFVAEEERDEAPAVQGVPGREEADQ